jgi:threonine dehydrogenase-like Zn-dependent dehydrogenase
MRRLEEVPRPRAGVGEAVIRTTLTTICGTDLHIVRGEYLVRLGLVIGAVRLLVGVTPAGQKVQRGSAIYFAVKVWR